jgi:hypothetical protein
LGLPVDASAREINRQVQRKQMTATTGCDDFKEAADFLQPDSSPDGDAVQAAVQRLRDPELRVTDEFFWFWPLPAENSEGDDTFLSALRDGDYQRTVAVLRKYERKQNDNPVYCHNLAVLSHALALDMEHTALAQTSAEEQRRQKEFYWRYAYSKWKTCLDHEGLWRCLRERIRELDDPRIPTGIVRRFRATLPIALLSINARLCTLAAEKGDRHEADWHLQLMKNAGLATASVNEAIRLVGASIHEEVRLQCKSARKEAEHNPERAEQISRRLIDETRRPLAVIKTVLQPGHPEREAAGDDVALTVLECQIAFVLKTDNLRTSLDPLQQARSIAETESARQRIQENITIIKDNLECKPCWFCEEYLAKGKTNLNVKTRGRLIRARTRNAPTNQRQPATVEVPRCVRCRSVHIRIRMFVAAGGALGGLASLGVGAAMLSAGAGPVMQGLNILGIGLAIGIGSTMGYAIGWAFAPEGVKPESAKKEYPGAGTSIGEGWEAGCKPAHVR